MSDAPPKKPPVKENEEPTPPKEGEQPKETPSSEPSDTFDPTTFQKKIEDSLTGKISQSIQSLKDELGKSLGLTKKEEEEIPDDAQGIKKYVDDRLDAKFKEYDKSKNDEISQTEKQRKTQVTNIIKGWDDEYESMVSQGMAPPIKVRNDDTDPGWIARRALISGVGEIIKAEQAEGKKRTPSLYEAIARNPRILKGVPGANLPISGDSPHSQKVDYDYKDIHNQTQEQIIESS